MRILVIPDSFKESLSAVAVAKAIAAGLQGFDRVTEVNALPFSDGGEGAIDLLESLFDGSRVEVQTVDALGRSIRAPYFKFKDQPTAWIELSQASGLAQIETELRDPKITSTYGSGLQIKHALDSGCTQIYLGLGGSATNDAATGLLSALGALFSDENGEPLEPGGAALERLAHIDVEAVPLFQLYIACDVDHQLLGPNGATHTFAPQKGADPSMVDLLEHALSNFAQKASALSHVDCAKVRKGGAAGGCAASLHALLGAKIESGFELLSDLAHLDEKIAAADLVITAEGRIDGQSIHGKLPSALGLKCKALNKPLVVFAGALDGPFEDLYEMGVHGIFSIQSGPISLEESKERAADLLQEAVKRFFYFYQNQLPS
jgi:glycerate 2-kinase